MVHHDTLTVNYNCVYIECFPCIRYCLWLTYLFFQTRQIIISLMLHTLSKNSVAWPLRVDPCLYFVALWMFCETFLTLLCTAWTESRFQQIYFLRNTGGIISNCWIFIHIFRNTCEGSMKFSKLNFKTVVLSWLVFCDWLTHFNELRRNFFLTGFWKIHTESSGLFTIPGLSSTHHYFSLCITSFAEDPFL